MIFVKSKEIMKNYTKNTNKNTTRKNALYFTFNYFAE